jgi:hypothetical protein
LNPTKIAAIPALIVALVALGYAGLHCCADCVIGFVWSGEAERPTFPVTAS